MPIFIETEDTNPFAGAKIGGGYDGPSPVRTDEYGRSRAPDWSVGDYPSRTNVDHGPTGYDRDQWGSNEGGWDMSGIKKLFHDTKDRYSQWSDQSPELWYNKEYTRSRPTFGWQSSPGSTMVQKDWMDQQARLGFPANLDYQANVTDEYGRRRKYSHYPENIRERRNDLWGGPEGDWDYRSFDEYGRARNWYTDLLQQTDVDIYGKPRSYPGSNIEERGKSLMETMYNPEPTRGRSLWEPDYVADLETMDNDMMDEIELAKIYQSGDPGMINEGSNWNFMPGGDPLWDEVSPQGEAINQILQDPSLQKIIQGLIKSGETDPNVFRQYIRPDILEQLPPGAFTTIDDFINQQPITVI